MRNAVCVHGIFGKDAKETEIISISLASLVSLTT
jgi:hypothetical protein